MILYVHKRINCGFIIKRVGDKLKKTCGFFLAIILTAVLTGGCHPGTVSNSESGGSAVSVLTTQSDIPDISDDSPLSPSSWTPCKQTTASERGSQTTTLGNKTNVTGTIPAETKGASTLANTQAPTSTVPEPIYHKRGTVVFSGSYFANSKQEYQQMKQISAIYGIEMKSVILNRQNFFSYLLTRAYDYVVFQESVTHPGDDKQAFLSEVKAHCDVAKQQRIPIILFNPAWPDKADQEKMTAIYEQAAKENGVFLANAGDVWEYACRKKPGLSLFQEGSVYANDEGAYLTACVFSSMLFDLHIKDIPQNSLYTGANASLLGQAAWESVSYYKANGKYPTETVTVAPGNNKRLNP